MDTSFPAEVQTPTTAVLRLAAGFGISQALFVAAKLGIADILRDSPKPVDTIAERAAVDREALYRLLRALASVGVFTESHRRTFRNTPLSETFLDGASGSLRPFLIMSREQECWHPWGELLHSIQTGKPAFQYVYETPFFDYLAAHPEPAQIFDEGMASRSAAEIAAILSVYDFSCARSIVDVGGGSGVLLDEVLKAAPDAKGILYDLPSVIARARHSMNMSARSRLDFVSGNFFSQVPAGGDLYLMKKIIHDWPDDLATQILKNCRAAMLPTSILLLAELVVPPGDGATFTKFLDLWMLVWPGGRERTEEEYRLILEAAGLSLRRVVPTCSPISIVEAVLA